MLRMVTMGDARMAIPAIPGIPAIPAIPGIDTGRSHEVVGLQFSNPGLWQGSVDSDGRTY